MRLGFIGLGAVVETAYLPALRRLAPAVEAVLGFDIDPARSPDGVERCASLDALFAASPDLVLVTTSSVSHLAALEQALASRAPRIVVEKPVVAELVQIDRLKALLAPPAAASRVLALDHWTARSKGLAAGRVGHEWIGADERPRFSLADVARLEGFLQEPSGFNEAGEPIALNFATRTPDTRTLRHPDGVILDIGTHVLALMREVVHALGGKDDLALDLVEAKDRLGRPIATGDLTTAEGKARLEGSLGGIPVELWLDKYAGPAGGRKGIRIHLRDGRTLDQDMREGKDVIELVDGGRVSRWQRAGGIYGHCIADQLLGPHAVFQAAPDLVPGMTRRRIAEVESLLRVQQALRGPH
jgi:hypothetical protein